LGDRKKALSLFNEALKLDPENRLARDYKDRILGLDPSLLDAQTLGPRDPGNNYAEAKKFIQENRFVEAIEVLERALKLNPNDLKADQLLADARGRQRELTEQGLSRRSDRVLPRGPGGSHSKTRRSASN
jgi:tetratricopeptide (TPR) repeat protein